jgi:hypothetical protein
MASKQTAVEWLKEQLFDPYIMDELMTNQYYREPLEFKIKDLFERAKAMEKEQIVDAYDEGNAEWTAIIYTDAKHYYTSTFNS